MEETPACDHSKNSVEQYFHVALLIMLHEVVPLSSSQSYAVLFAVDNFATQCDFNLKIFISLCDNSKQR